MVKRILALAVTLTIGGNCLHAQVCIDELKQSVEALSERINAEDATSCHVNYSLEQELADGRKETHRFDVYSAGNRHYLFSKDVSVMADESLTVSIQKPGEIIYIGQSLNTEIRQKSIDRVLQQQLGGIDVLELQSCEEIEVGGKQRTRLTLTCPLAYQDVYHVTTVVYEFDKSFIYRVTAHGTAKAHIQVLTYRIHTVETNQQHAQLDKEPTQFILDSNGKLLPQYQGYSIEQMGDATSATNLPSSKQQKN